MKKHVVTLSSIMEEEHARLLDAQKNYGGVFMHALDVYDLLENFLVDFNKPYDHSVDLFPKFFNSARNFYLLTLFSDARLHHAQSSYDLRQFIESGVNAAYSLANPNYDDFVKENKFKILKPVKKKKRYNWIHEHYPDRSKDLIRIKKSVQFSTHSNFVDTNRNTHFNFSNPTNPQLHLSFFDKDDVYLILTDFWQLANTGLAILALLYEVNRDHKKLNIVTDFVTLFGNLMNINQAIKGEFMKTDRFKSGDEVAKKEEAEQKAKDSVRKQKK